MNTATGTGETRVGAFVAIVGGAAVLTFVPGIAALLDFNALPGNETRTVVAMVQILFSLLCLSLVLYVRVRGTREPADSVFVSGLAVLCLFQNYRDGASSVWITVFPPVAVFLLGGRRGLRMALGVGAGSVLTLALRGRPIDPAGLDVSLAAVYFIVAAFSRYAAAGKASAPEGAEADREESSGAGGEVGPGSDRAALPRVPEDDADEIFVLYRKDALATIAAIPAPEAVFSYLLLEGLGGARLSDDEAGPESRRLDVESADFECRSLSIDELLAKAERIIDVREAKKLMEYNKIQSQLDSVLSHESNDASGFDRLCFQYGLSEREAGVAKCILKGSTNKEISEELFISIETVKTHVKNLLKKCGIGSRIDFIKLFSKT